MSHTYTIADAPPPSKSLAMLRYKLNEVGIRGFAEEEACENFLFYWQPGSGVTAEMISQVMGLQMDFLRWMYTFVIFLNPADWVKLNNEMGKMR